MPENFENLVTNALQARREGRSHDARRDLIAAVDLCRRAPAPSDLARALTDLGQIERDLGHLDAALKHYEEAAAIYRAQNNPPGSLIRFGTSETSTDRLAARLWRNPATTRHSASIAMTSKRRRSIWRTQSED